MSNQIIKTVLQDGTKSAVVHYSFISDGVEGELNNQVILDPVTDLTGVDFRIGLIITQIWFGFSWFDALLSFEGESTNIPAVALTRDVHNYMDYRYFGGIKDRSNTLQPDRGTQFGERLDQKQNQFPTPDDVIYSSRTPTGRILMSTKDFINPGSFGTMVIEVKKNLTGNI